MWVTSWQGSFLPIRSPHMRRVCEHHFLLHLLLLWESADVFVLFKRCFRAGWGWWRVGRCRGRGVSVSDVIGLSLLYYREYLFLHAVGFCLSAHRQQTLWQIVLHDYRVGVTITENFAVKRDEMRVSEVTWCLSLTFECSLRQSKTPSPRSKHR